MEAAAESGNRACPNSQPLTDPEAGPEWRAGVAPGCGQAMSLSLLAVAHPVCPWRGLDLGTTTV